jgi:hypothetical protein
VRGPEIGDRQHVRVVAEPAVNPSGLLGGAQVQQNECFSSLDGVTDAEQQLADYIHSWFVAWIKNPSAG